LYFKVVDILTCVKYGKLYISKIHKIEPSLRVQVLEHWRCVFEIKVGAYQGSWLSPLLFIIGMDAVRDYVRHDVPWDMLYADDLILADISPAKLQQRFSEWQEALEKVKALK